MKYSLARRVLLVSSALACIALSPRHAAAQSIGDSAAAQMLFDEGKRLYQEKQFDKACPKLEESRRLEPVGGTILFLALCHAGQGKTATAWAEFNDALSLARRDARPDRATVAKAQIAALTPKLCRLQITTSSDGKNVQIARDGSPVGDAQLGAPVPVDPGEHVVSASMPGKVSWTTRVTVEAEGQTATVSVPALEDEPKTAVALTLSPSPRPAVAAPESERHAEPKASRGGTQRTAAIAAGAAGVVALGVGTVFGLQSKSKHDQASDRCALGPNHDRCDADGHQLETDARQAGTVSTIAFAAGAGALLLGGVLFFTAPRAETSSPPRTVYLTPTASPKTAGLLLRGSF